MNVSNQKMVAGQGWDSLRVGDRASFVKVVSREAIDAFILITGDDSSLHLNKDFAERKGFKGQVVHGMLLGSYFSTLVGKYFLGEDNLLLSKKIDFKKVVLVGDQVTISGVIRHKMEASRVLEIETVIKNSRGEKVVVGYARVKYI